MSLASVGYIIRRTYVESKFGPYSASSATRWCLTKKMTLKSTFVGSISSRTVLEVNALSILSLLKILISQGPILKIEFLMTFNDLDSDFTTFNLKNLMFHEAFLLILLDLRLIYSK